MKSILITGANGYIASNIAENLNKQLKFRAMPRQIYVI